jgi:lipopolysaccharide transport system permease protein
MPFDAKSSPLVCHSAERDLARPVAFVRSALTDLRGSVRVAGSLFRAMLRARHRRAGLGYLWLAAPGIATAAACMVMRAGHVVVIGATDLPYPVFAVTGMFLWQGMAEAITLPMQQLAAHRRFLSRMPVPHESVVLASFGEVSLNTAVRLAMLMLLLVGFGTPLSTGWLAVPVAAAVMMAIGLAVGSCLAPFALLFEDVARAVGLLLNFALFLTPVFYPLPGDSPLALNPVVPVLDLARSALAGHPVAVRPVALVMTGAIVLMSAGWLQYRVARLHLMARAG